MKKDVATQQACGCDLHSSLKPETWKLHHHLGSFHPRCLTSKVMSAWPPNLTNMVSRFRIHFGALKMSGLSRAENHLRLSLLPWFFWSKGWAMAEKARPRIVAERHRLSFGHCHRDPHLNDPPFSRHGASELGVGGSHPCSRRFPNTSVELLAKSEEKPEKSPNLATFWVI